jgi:hypothetical protein
MDLSGSIRLTWSDTTANVSFGVSSRAGYIDSGFAERPIRWHLIHYVL